MTSLNGSIFRPNGLLCGEYTGHRWIAHTKANGAELWCFPWSASETAVELTMPTPVIWDAISLIMTSVSWRRSGISLYTFLFKWRHLSVSNHGSAVVYSISRPPARPMPWRHCNSVLFSSEVRILYIRETDHYRTRKCINISYRI